MSRSVHFDYLLAGSTGQIGRALFRELGQRGTVCPALRGADKLPPARHVINAAGFTLFEKAGAIEKYWEDNIMYAVQLAEHAREVGAEFHQLSSHGVAEFRPIPLLEYNEPVLMSRMKTYTKSKILTELAVTSAMPSGTVIYRVSDVVPSAYNMKEDWRRNHWLSVLFCAGKQAFTTLPDDYPVWIANVDDLARVLAFLINEKAKEPVHHVLGLKYKWATFRDAALDQGDVAAGRLVPKVLKHVGIQPPLAESVDSVITAPLLEDHGFFWTPLGREYWEQYAERSSAW